MHFITKEFNGKEYTLVEELTEFGQDIIYHFEGDEDEVFCLLNNGEYIIIEYNEKIKQIKEDLYGEIDGILFSIQDFIQKIEYAINLRKEIGKEQKAEFLLEQVQVLEQLEEFNEKQVSKRLNNVGVFTIKRMPLGTAAFYRRSDDAMYFTEEDIIEDDIFAKRVRLHETIHSIIGPIKNALLDRIAGRGLVEGATESLVERIYGDDEKDISIFGYMKFNLSNNCTYKKLVSIIRQIEFITKKSSVDFALNGNNQIFKEFSQKYGKDLFRYIKCKTKRLANKRIKEKDADRILMGLQETILIGVFDKEFESVTSLQTAEQYMLRLSQFEGTRVWIKGDNSFAEYYNDKMSKILTMLEKQGTSEDKIDSFLTKYQYKGWIASLNEPPEVDYKRKQSELIDCITILIKDCDYKFFDSENVEDTLGKVQMFTYETFGTRINTIVLNGKIVGNVTINANGTIDFSKYYIRNQDLNEELNRKCGKNVEEASQDEINEACNSIQQRALEWQRANWLMTDLDEQAAKENAVFIEHIIMQRKRINGIAMKQRTSQMQTRYNAIKALINQTIEKAKLKLEELEDGKFNR